MTYKRISPSKRRKIQQLVDRAWKADLHDATFSQILRYTEEWTEKIEKAERANH